MSRRSKVIAVTLMALSWLILIWRTDGPWAPGVVAVVLVVVGTWLLRRPEPSGPA